jgi:hypothetical protein
MSGIHAPSGFPAGNVTLGGHLTLANDKHVILTDDQNNGSINRLIELHSTFNVDRPSISWVDDAGRHVTTLLTHYKLIDALGGDVHQALEIKTVASATGPDPSDFRTRLSIGYNAQRTKFGMPSIDVLELFQGENPVTVDTPPAIASFGIDFRAVPQDTATAGAGNFKCGNLYCQVDANDNMTMFLDVNAPYNTAPGTFTGPLGLIPAGNKSVVLSIFRNTNISSGSNPQIAVKKGDGTNTNALVFTAKSGLLDLPLAASGTTGIKLGGDAVATLYRPAASTLKTDATFVAALGVATFVKAGTPTDADFTTPTNGILVVDTTGNKIWARTAAATWKGVAIA